MCWYWWNWYCVTRRVSLGTTGGGALPTDAVEGLRLGTGGLGLSTVEAVMSAAIEGAGAAGVGGRGSGASDGGSGTLHSCSSGYDERSRAIGGSRSRYGQC